MSLGFYSKSEVCLVPSCPDGIGRTWDRTGLGSDGHGIPSGIGVTFCGIPPRNERTWDPFWDRCDLPWDSSWERMDMGSLLGSM